MNWAFIIDLTRLALATLGLVFLGRLLRTARIYVSWRAFVYYGAAWLVFPVVGFLRLSAFGMSDGLALRQAFETLFFLAVGGSLWEHVRADQRRHRDSRRLIEQWRLSSGLSRQRANELEVLSAITSQLVSSLDLRQVLQAVVD